MSYLWCAMKIKKRQAVVVYFVCCLLLQVVNCLVIARAELLPKNALVFLSRMPYDPIPSASIQSSNSTNSNRRRLRSSFNDKIVPRSNNNNNNNKVRITFVKTRAADQQQQHQELATTKIVQPQPVRARNFINDDDELLLQQQHENWPVEQSLVTVLREPAGGSGGSFNKTINSTLLAIKSTPKHQRQTTSNNNNHTSNANATDELTAAMEEIDTALPTMYHGKIGWKPPPPKKDRWLNNSPAIKQWNNITSFKHRAPYLEALNAEGTAAAAGSNADATSDGSQAVAIHAVSTPLFAALERLFKVLTIFPHQTAPAFSPDTGQMPHMITMMPAGASHPIFILRPDLTSPNYFAPRLPPSLPRILRPATTKALSSTAAAAAGAVQNTLQVLGGPPPAAANRFDTNTKLSSNSQKFTPLFFGSNAAAGGGHGQWSPVALLRPSLMTKLALTELPVARNFAATDNSLDQILTKFPPLYSYHSVYVVHAPSHSSSVNVSTATKPIPAMPSSSAVAARQPVRRRHFALPTSNKGLLDYLRKNGFHSYTRRLPLAPAPAQPTTTSVVMEPDARQSNKIYNNNNNQATSSQMLNAVTAEPQGYKVYGLKSEPKQQEQPKRHLLLPSAASYKKGTTDSISSSSISINDDNHVVQVAPAPVFVTAMPPPLPLPLPLPMSQLPRARVLSAYRPEQHGGLATTALNPELFALVPSYLDADRRGERRIQQQQQQYQQPLEIIGNNNSTLFYTPYVKPYYYEYYSRSKYPDKSAAAAPSPKNNNNNERFFLEKDIGSRHFVGQTTKTTTMQDNNNAHVQSEKRHESTPQNNNEDLQKRLQQQQNTVQLQAVESSVRRQRKNPNSSWNILELGSVGDPWDEIAPAAATTEATIQTKMFWWRRTNKAAAQEEALPQHSSTTTMRKNRRRKKQQQQQLRLHKTM